MSWVRAAFAAILGLALIGCASERTSALVPSEPADPRQQVTGTGVICRFGLPGTSFWTPQYGLSIRLDADRNVIEMSGGERNPLADSRDAMPPPYKTWSKSFPVDFVPTAASFRTGNELYVAGSSPDGSIVVERWDFPRIPGAYFSERGSPVPASPLGVPLVTPPLLVGIECGAYQVPSQRPGPTPSRMTLYRGHSVGVITGIGVDPDARFLLIVEASQGGRLVQALLQEPMYFHEIARESEFPGLIHSGGPRAMDHRDLGRLWPMMVGSSMVWIEDPTNDGILDRIGALGFREYCMAFPDEALTMVHP